MNKPKRRKIQREWLDNQLAKYERRIQKLAENAYHIRQAIELLDAQEAARNHEKGETTDAIYQSGIEAATSGGESNPNAGEPNVSDSADNQEVLGQQSA